MGGDAAARQALEIQALWYNALRVMEQLAHAFDDEAGHAHYGALAARAHQSFNQVFWNEAAECLYDVVDRDSRDGSIRPNQIFAVSLPYTLLPSDHARRVVEVTQRELLTPYGLRTLAPSDPRYRGRCEGDQWSRDTVYHQGSVWPWLLGAFLTAYIKVHGGTRESRAQAARWLAGFREHLEDGSLGQLSKLFDGNAPHRPRGCIAQAWSVAELLRAIIEDLIGFTPATPQVTAGQQANLTQRSAEKGEST